MVKEKVFDDILRANGRVPKGDMDEARERKVDEMEGLSDEYFDEDDDDWYYDEDEDEEEMRKEREWLDKKELFRQEAHFYAFVLLMGTAIVGTIYVTGRFIVYPLIKIFVRDYDG